MEKKVNKPAKFKIRKGDLVKVIAGDAKGQQGTVLEVIVRTSRVIVEGVNLIKKHSKPSAANPNGGIISKEAALHISNLMFVDAKGNATRVGRKVTADQKIVRISKKSGEEIK